MQRSYSSGDADRVATLAVGTGAGPAAPARRTTVSAAAGPAPWTSWVPAYLANALTWGSTFVFIKVGVRQLHPLYLTLGRVVTGALTVLAILLLVRGRLPRDPRVWGHLVVVGIVGAAMPFSLFGYGEQRVSSILAGIWNATTPLLALPVSALVMRTERMTARRLVGVLTGFVGVLVVLGIWRGVGGAGLTGQLMCLGAAVCYGITIPYQRRFLSHLPGSGVAVPAGQLIVATAFLAVLAPLVAGPPPAPRGLHGSVIASVLALGASGTGLAFVFNFRVVRLAGASTAASVTYLLPVVAASIGVLALHERLRWYQPVGALIVLAGVAVAQGLRLSRPRRRARPGRPGGAARPATANRHVSGGDGEAGAQQRTVA